MLHIVVVNAQQRPEVGEKGQGAQEGDEGGHCGGALLRPLREDHEGAAQQQQLPQGPQALELCMERPVDVHVRKHSGWHLGGSVAGHEARGGCQRLCAEREGPRQRREACAGLHSAARARAVCTRQQAIARKCPCYRLRIDVDALPSARPGRWPHGVALLQQLRGRRRKVRQQRWAGNGGEGDQESGVGEGRDDDCGALLSTTRQPLVATLPCKREAAQPPPECESMALVLGGTAERQE